MSNKKNISIEDRGWDAMKTILEREMPQKKKRRIAPWLIFGVLFIIGSCSIALFMNTSGSQGLTESTNKTIAETVVERPATEPVNSQKKKNAEVPILNQEEIQIAASTFSDNNNTPPVEESQSETKSLQVEQEMKSSILREKTYPSPLTGKTTIETNDHSENEVDATSELQNEIATPSEIQSKETEIELERTEAFPTFKNEFPIIERAEEPTMDPLPHIKPLLNLGRKITIKDVPKAIVNVNTSSGFSPYVFLGGNYQPNINGLGYGVGAGFNYQIEKVGIYLEASYSKSQYSIGEVSPNFSPSGTTIENGGSFIEDNGLAANEVSEDLRFENFSNLTSGISELKVGLGMRTRIVKKLNLNIGVAYAHLLRAQNKSVSVNLPVENTFLDNSTVNVSASELYNTGAYASYDIIPHIGLEYNFLPRAFFGLSYNYGTVNLIANTNLQNLNSLSEDESIIRKNVEARIRYQF